jgi:steroid delta-isomerase-like uncharacterized protein
MSTNKARDLVSRYIEMVWNRGDLAAFKSLTTESFTYQIGGQSERNRLGMQQFIGMIRTAFPDWRVDIVEMITENDKVAVRWQGQVTHQGPFYRLPPTGRQIKVSGINIYRLVDGKVDAEWEQTDSLGMLQQLGALPAV